MSILSRLLPREAGFFEYFENHDPAYIWVVLCGLLGAIVWDLLTWWWGLPTSSSHALIGGFAGAGVAHAGFGILNWKNIWKAVEFIPLAPLMGMVVGFSLMVGTYWLFRRWRPSSVDRVFRKGQLVSAALCSLGHGANDAQKTMGIIVALLIAAGYMKAGMQLSLTDSGTMWIILSCHAAMAIGTALGGWRIVRTMGMKITKLKPVGGKLPVNFRFPALKVETAKEDGLLMQRYVDVDLVPVSAETPLGVKESPAKRWIMAGLALLCVLAGFLAWRKLRPRKQQVAEDTTIPLPTRLTPVTVLGYLQRLKVPTDRRAELDREIHLLESRHFGPSAPEPDTAALTEIATRWQGQTSLGVRP